LRGRIAEEIQDVKPTIMPQGSHQHVCEPSSLPLRLATLTALSLASSCGARPGRAARDQVRVVGSSTVYPFAKAVAESLARSRCFDQVADRRIDRHRVRA